MAYYFMARGKPHQHYREAVKVMGDGMLQVVPKEIARANMNEATTASPANN